MPPRKGHFQGLRQTGAGSLRGANIGFGRDSHADVSSECRKHGANHKCDHDEPVRGFHQVRHETQKGTCDHNENGENAIFSTQKGQRPFVDVPGDFDHAVITGVLGLDPT